MLRHTWKPIAVLAAGALLALSAGVPPESPAKAQDAGEAQGDLANLPADGLTRAELVSLYLALAGAQFEPPA
jgi:hypothetical protein